MLRRIRHLELLILFIAGMTPCAWAEISNGDFSSDLSGWTAAGDVSVVSGAAALGDVDTSSSALYQPVAWPEATFTIDFDFRSDISQAAPQGTFPDSFFASIYYTDDPGSFSTLPGGFDSAIGLFDLDANGTFNVNGSITASSLGADWLHYSGTFANSSAYIIPYFELQNLNGQPDANSVVADSTVYLDNISLVPEPGTLALCLTGSLLLLANRRIRRA